MIHFTVLGEPVAQGRPRTGKTRRGKTIVYDPSSSRDYKQYVQLVASQHAPEELLEGSLDLLIKVYRPIPKSFSKKKTAEAEAGVLRPVTKPDNTNYAKGIEDALNGVIYKDDSLIVDLHVSKYYSLKPRIVVEVSEVGK
ncbi:RusA family crossover junction endodeoxyribonuclease [Halobacillus massiliensis]|uniref:RusA family crossover junction endodeoxyribonuclease n=1 Tax=Halobacillus massiliensis TaxID=1926286 RepID=UPI0009E57538|nr:RusA family crossover junction endodeoxyribonuclease [Halobacillus massiliensis]